MFPPRLIGSQAREYAECHRIALPRERVFWLVVLGVLHHLENGSGLVN